MSKFIAIQVIAQLPEDTADTLEEREALDARIIAAFGCDGTEPTCPMEWYASTVVADLDGAYAWFC